MLDIFDFIAILFTAERPISGGSQDFASPHGKSYNRYEERDSMDLYAEIREMIIRELALDKELVVSEAHLQDDLGADSLALLNLAENIGKQYDVEIEGDDLVDIENVDGLVKLDESRISLKS